MKFAFVFFFAITWVMSIVAVPDVEAKQLAPEEAPYVLLHREAVSCFRSSFASSSPSVCNHESEQFWFDIHSKCPPSMYPTPPIEIDGDSLDRLMALHHDGNAYVSVLFYASCVLTRYGIHSLPSILMVNQTSKARYHGRKDLTSLIEFYEESTGLKPVQYVSEPEPTTSVDATDGNMITWLRKGTSISEVFKGDPFLVLSLLFVCLQAAILVFPMAEQRLKALWASYVPNLNLERFGEVSQVFRRAVHMVDVRRLWLKLTLVKTRSFHERAKNARAWASSLASVSLGQTSSNQS
ncbi:hypothetical protein HID58_003836 [Brassica napus]|uniref:Thioredoxin domain-containing protein n=1 Tax=Brassica napus TaxID=3708 RepID=A0ABQ8ERL2_BRANA|nr:hypothetical protein HID58_003836 [Brassica napus]